MKEFEVDDDPGRVDIDAVCEFLTTQPYWGRWRTPDIIRAQITSAWRVVGAYTPAGAQVGFARAISDGFGVAYLADVYVHSAHRGRGLGKRILEIMIDNGPGRHFRWMLHTNDAHGIYTQFGFAEPDHTYLERRGGAPSTSP